MRYWVLFAAFFPAVCTDSEHTTQLGPLFPRALDSRFDLTSLKTSHVIVFRPTTPAPVDSSAFSYEGAGLSVELDGSILVKRDDWISIPVSYVTIDPRGSTADIDLNPLNLDPGATYEIAYEVDEREPPYQEFEMPEIAGPDTPSPSFTTVISTAQVVPSANYPESSFNEFSPSAPPLETSTDQFVLSATATETSTDEMNASITDAPFTTVTQDPGANSAPVASSTSPIGNSSPPSGATHGTLARSWSLFLLVLWIV